MLNQNDHICKHIAGRNSKLKQKRNPHQNQPNQSQNKPRACSEEDETAGGRPSHPKQNPPH
jgi:hypothetical protein